MEFIDLKAQQLPIKDKIDAGIQRVLNHGKYYGDGSAIFV